MAAYRTAPADRIRAGFPVLLIHVLLGYGLLRGLDYAPPVLPEDVLRLVDLAPEDLPPPIEEPPPPPPPSIGAQAPERAADPRPEGAASPPNLEAQPTSVVRPDPIIRQPVPTPITAAPIAGTGRAASAGAAPIPGPGIGSGGFGTGTGSGRSGGGPGGGGGGGGTGGGWAVTPPRRLAGDLSIDDLPDALRAAGFRGEVEVRYRVEADGRATSCRPIRSSGSRLVDEMTCNLIERRFRFRPSRDRSGRPTHSFIEENHYFESEGDWVPPPPRRRGW